MNPAPNLPEGLAELLRPLFATHPLNLSMPSLRGQCESPQKELVESLVNGPVLIARPHLVAALWLYVDELDRSHEISQSLNDETAAWWHGIMHRREGDYDNARYWMRRCTRHPLRNQINPVKLISDVEREIGRSTAESFPVEENIAGLSSGISRIEELRDQQRSEWKTLFEWTALNLP